ncbi:MAG: hypothetical protein Q4B70_00085 [Lachnospiraceae bacterium]|nr:hypothetical protein [Lachnospiraceae bacterium]
MCKEESQEILYLIATYLLRGNQITEQEYKKLWERLSKENSERNNKYK